MEKKAKNDRGNEEEEEDGRIFDGILPVNGVLRITAFRICKNFLYFFQCNLSLAFL